MRLARGVLVRCALLAAVILGAARAGAVDWRWSFRRLRGPHFDVVYNKDQRALARHYLIAAERAHELVFPLFNEGPARTLIVLQDDTDESNGEANYLPYPHIRVYPVLPTSTSGLGEYGDWAVELLVHEYTHILNMYPAHGFYRPLSYVFGSLVRPNALLPIWYLEGLAVDLESALTPHGRLRAFETHAAARALTAGDRFAKENIATLGEQGLLSWPYGNRPYLFGGWWWETVVQHGAGVAAIENMNLGFSRRLPFLLNAPMRQHTLHTPAEWWALTTERLRTSGERELASLRAAGAPEPRPLIPADGEQRAFALSPSGRRLVYAQYSPRVPGAVKLRTRDRDGQPFTEAPSEVLFRAVGPANVRWLDEDRFVFDQIDPNRPFVTYRDLYLYDVGRRTKTRLTRNERAQQPAPSPSGRLVAFVKNDGGRHALCTVEVDSGRVRRWLTADFTQRLGSPAFTSEDDLLFSLRTRDGRERVRRLSLPTRQITNALESLSTVSGLRRTHGGTLLTDAGTGVRNGYLWADGGTAAEALTNSLTHVDDLDLDPQTNEVITNELTADGRRLLAVPRAPQTPPVITPEPLGDAPTPPPVKFRIEDLGYHPLSYLVPRYWMPMIYQVENGLIFQGSTTGADPIGRNSYDLSASFDTITHKPSYGFTFTNQSLPTQIGLGYAKAQTYLGASGSILEAQRADLNFRQNWPLGTKRFASRFGATWLDTTSSVASYRRAGPVAGFSTSTLDSPLGAWHALQLEFLHQEFLNQPGYYAYGRSSLNLTNTAQLGGGHRVSLVTRGVLSPRLPLSSVVTLGERNVGGNFMVNLVGSDLMMRGYPSGNFVGRKVINANLEYAFPMVPLDRGWGTLPLFLRNFEIALFLDAMAVDGGAYNYDRKGYELSRLSHPYTGTGAELRLISSVGYHLPLTTTLGLYYGTDLTHGGGLSPFIAFGLGGLEGLKSAAKTP